MLSRWHPLVVSFSFPFQECVSQLMRDARKANIPMVIDGVSDNKVGKADNEGIFYIVMWENGGRR